MSTKKDSTTTNVEEIASAHSDDISTGKTRKRHAHLTMLLDPGASGYQLIYQILDKANQEGITASTLCRKYLNISPGYWTMLRDGTARPESLSTDVIKSIAQFLNITPFAIRLLANQITPDEFYQQDKIQHEIDNAIAFIRRDADWGPILPLDAEHNASKDWKLFAILSFQKATGKKLLTDGVDYGSLINQDK